MFRRTAFVVLIATVLASVTASADPDPKIKPVVRLTKIKPRPDIFDSASRKKPVVIRTAADAAKHFSKAEAAKLAKQVDYKQQFVLVFAWRGSGQDTLTTTVMESYPEQVLFTYKPGRSDDLRPHIYIQVLRSNVKWKVR